LADERDPIAAEKNASGNFDPNNPSKRNFTDAFEQPDRQGVVGPGNDPQHRAGPGEGVRAPFAEHEGGDPQISVFDGKGNEQVVVASANREGNLAQGTGPDSESARAEAQDGEAHPGSAFINPEPKDGMSR
jgi:hypothetical protein